jgi:RHS repeat-associated protein
MEFIILADGSYAPPPGETARLQKNGDNTYSLLERFGGRTDFDASRRIVRVSDLDGNVLTFTYSGGTLSSVQDASGRVITLGYVNNRLSTVSDSSGRGVGYGYNEKNELTSYTDPEGKVWGYGYDDHHRMTTMTNPLPVISVTNGYDTLGRVKEQIQPRQSQPGGASTATYQFFFTGQSSALLDPAGNLTVFDFDDKGRTLAETNPLGQQNTMAYDGQNHLILRVDPRQNKTRYQFDGNHNLTTTIHGADALNYQTTYQYDTQFRLTDIIDSGSSLHTTHFGYDSKHHPTLTRDAVGNTFLATYNGPKGARDSATDGRTITTNFTYDAFGTPRTSQVAGQPAITYEYDAIGRLKSLTDQFGSKTSFDYDKRNLLREKTDPLTGKTAFIYNNAGQLTKKTDRNGTIIDYAYTPSGKLETVTYPAGWGTVGFTYNLQDQLTAMQDNSGSTLYRYDAAGRLSGTTNPYGLVVSYAYDSAGNLTELTYPGNKKVIYGYDTLNRLKTVTIDWLPGRPVATYTYKANELNLLESLDQFNGITTGYGYDNAHRLTSSTSQVASYTITLLDGNGNRRSITQSEPLALAIAAKTTDLAYNDKKNRLQSAGAESFSYDNEGQLASGYGSSFSFDPAHRLTSAGPASYSYDGAGNRLQAVRSGVTTRYLYDAGGNLLAETDASNTISRYYIHGLGLLAMVTPANQVYNYHYNTIGSTVALTDQGKTVVNKYAYDPFGNLGNQEETIPQPFKYVGQAGVMSEANGLYYMRARYYDPKVGRFISEDPLGFDGGDVNLLAYVGGNPIRLILAGLKLVQLLQQLHIRSQWIQVHLLIVQNIILIPFTIGRQHSHLSLLLIKY